MANLAFCAICGKKYNYCPSCSKTHAWKFYTDTHKHYQIYMIIEEFNSGVFSIREAKTALENIGITANTDLSDINPSVAEQLRSIVSFTENNHAKSRKKKNELRQHRTKTA